MLKAKASVRKPPRSSRQKFSAKMAGAGLFGEVSAQWAVFREDTELVFQVLVWIHVFLKAVAVPVKRLTLLGRWFHLFHCWLAWAVFAVDVEFDLLKT